MTIDRLFVYGTLRPAGSAFDLISDLVVRHEPAVLVDHGLVGEGHRYPWCIEAPGQEVAGELLWLERVEEVLEAVDRYEGVDDPDPEYRRVLAEVMTSDGATSAWVYVGGPGVPPNAAWVGGGDWLGD